MNLTQKSYPTKTRLLELFDYDKEGFLIRKSTGKRNTVTGNYATISIDAKVYCVHKCILIMHSQYDTFHLIVNAHLQAKYDKLAIKLKLHKTIHHPWKVDVKNYVVDHIDQNKHNNKIENLRLLTREENFYNSNSNAKWSSFVWMSGKKKRDQWASENPDYIL